MGRVNHPHNGGAKEQAFTDAIPRRERGMGKMTSPWGKEKSPARCAAVVFFPIVISFQPSVSQRLTADIYFFCSVGDVAKRGLGLRQEADDGERERERERKDAEGIEANGGEGRAMGRLPPPPPAGLER